MADQGLMDELDAILGDDFLAGLAAPAPAAAAPAPVQPQQPPAQYNYMNTANLPPRQNQPGLAPAQAPMPQQSQTNATSANYGALPGPGQYTTPAPQGGAFAPGNSGAGPSMAQAGPGNRMSLSQTQQTSSPMYGTLPGPAPAKTGAALPQQQQQPLGVTTAPGAVQNRQSLSYGLQAQTQQSASPNYAALPSRGSSPSLGSSAPAQGQPQPQTQPQQHVVGTMTAPGGIMRPMQGQPMPTQQAPMQTQQAASPNYSALPPRGAAAQMNMTAPAGSFPGGGMLPLTTAPGALGSRPQGTIPAPQQSQQTHNPTYVSVADLPPRGAGPKPVVQTAPAGAINPMNTNTTNSDSPAALQYLQNRPSLGVVSAQQKQTTEEPIYLSVLSQKKPKAEDNEGFTGFPLGLGESAPAPAAAPVASPATASQTQTVKSDPLDNFASELDSMLSDDFLSSPSPSPAPAPAAAPAPQPQLQPQQQAPVQITKPAAVVDDFASELEDMLADNSFSTPAPAPAPVAAAPTPAPAPVPAPAPAHAPTQAPMPAYATMAPPSALPKLGGASRPVSVVASIDDLEAMFGDDSFDPSNVTRPEEPTPASEPKPVAVAAPAPTPASAPAPAPTMAPAYTTVPLAATSTPAPTPAPAPTQMTMPFAASAPSPSVSPIEPGRPASGSSAADRRGTRVVSLAEAEELLGDLVSSLTPPSSIDGVPAPHRKASTSISMIGAEPKQEEVKPEEPKPAEPAPSETKEPENPFIGMTPAQIMANQQQIMLQMGALQNEFLQFQMANTQNPGMMPPAEAQQHMQAFTSKLSDLQEKLKQLSAAQAAAKPVATPMAAPPPAAIPIVARRDSVPTTVNNSTVADATILPPSTGGPAPTPGATPMALPPPKLLGTPVPGILPVAGATPKMTVPLAAAPPPTAAAPKTGGAAKPANGILKAGPLLKLGGKKAFGQKWQLRKCCVLATGEMEWYDADPNDPSHAIFKGKMTLRGAAYKDIDNGHPDFGKLRKIGHKNIPKDNPDFMSFFSLYSSNKSKTYFFAVPMKYREAWKKAINEVSK